MPDNSLRLLILAEAEFPDLTEPEREVVRCAALGKEANLAQWGPQPAEEKKHKPGGGPLRSAVVGWLCTDARAKRRVHHKGIRIAFATLDMRLDLGLADVPFFFALQACWLPGLDAQGARFSSNLYLKHCHIDGILDIIGSRIGGQLLCNGALVRGNDGVSIRAEDAEIGCDVYLSNGFRSYGEVSLTGATIKGQLVCTGGCFLNPTGDALSVDSAKIGNSVLLSNGFLAVGAVCLPGSNISGDLVCRDGSFHNVSRNRQSSQPTGPHYSIYASCANIAGRVFLDGSFLSIGVVYFRSAEIHHLFDCKNGRFLNKKGTAFNAFCCTFKDSLNLTPSMVRGKIDLCRASIANDLTVAGATALHSCVLDLSGAHAARLCDSQTSWPATGQLLLDGFVCEDIDHDSPRSAAERLEWLQRMPSGQFLPQPYEQLAAWYQRTGHDSEARAVRIAKEWSRFKYFRNPFKKLWWLLKFIFIGFGHKPHYAAYWLIGLIVLGSFVYSNSIDLMTPSVSYNFNATEPTEGYAGLQASDYPNLNTLLYSTDVALPIVDLQQERYWMPNSSKPGGRFLWWFNWFEVLFGWFLASMGIAGATGIIRKD